MENKEYGIIREQGEYNEFVPLSSEENAAVNEAANNNEEN